MSPRTLFRLSGLALLLALPLQVVGFVLHPPTEEVVDVLKSTYGPSHIVLFVSWVFVLLGLPGLYARQAHRARLLGLAGFVLLMLIAAYHSFLLLYEAYATPVLARQAPALIGDGPLAHGAGALGPLAFALVLAFPLFGLVTVRAGVLPRWTGWLQILSLPVFVVGMMLIPEEALSGVLVVAQPIRLLYYLVFAGYAGGGYMLWREQEPVNAPAPRPAVPEPAG